MNVLSITFNKSLFYNKSITCFLLKSSSSSTSKITRAKKTTSVHCFIPLWFWKCIGVCFVIISLNSKFQTMVKLPGHGFKVFVTKKIYRKIQEIQKIQKIPRKGLHMLKYYCSKVLVSTIRSTISNLISLPFFSLTEVHRD